MSLVQGTKVGPYEIVAALNHPNIAAIYGLEGNALVMELVEGQDRHRAPDRRRRYEMDGHRSVDGACSCSSRAATVAARRQQTAGHRKQPAIMRSEVRQHIVMVKGQR